MISHEHSLVIHAPLSEVFAYVNAPETLPDWMTGMSEVRNIVGSGAGLQYDWTYTMVGVRLRGQNVVVEYVPDECAAHQSIGMVNSVWKAIVEPHVDGTKLLFQVEYTIPFPVLGKLAEHLTVRRNKRDVENYLLNVRDTLEANQ
jgi:uncharacterized membrane protein